MNETKDNRTRRMTTRWTVRLADKLAAGFITVGGVGTIIAVSGVFLFLVAVVIPLIQPGTIDPGSTVNSPSRSEVVHLAVDEYRVMGWTLSRDGELHGFRLDNGDPLLEQSLVNGDSVSATSVSTLGESVVFGYIDGTVRLGSLRFKTDYPESDELPPSAPELGVGELMTAGTAVIEKTPEGQFRRQRLQASVSAPIDGIPGKPIALIHHIGDGRIIAMLSTDGTLRVNSVERVENLMTGEIQYEVDGGEVETPYGSDSGEGLPSRMFVAESGTGVSLLWPDGTIVYYDTREIDAPVFAGESDVLDEGESMTAMAMLIGGETFLLGDNLGNVHGVFRYSRNDDVPGALRIAHAHLYEVGASPITAIAPSPNDRLFAVGSEDGSFALYQPTSEARILEQRIDGGAIEKLAVTPKGDGIVVLAAGHIHSFNVDPGYPEATLASLFAPVWYEGYAEPTQVWQSSSGTDDFEPKFGMWPLIFGTLKATFYSMLFGMPIALLAAIFTSEFMSAAVRPRVKTTIESMASLPSVVLGFLAALVIAPFAQRAVPAVIAAFVTIPFTLLLGAYVFQMLPHAFVLRASRFRLPFLFLCLPVGVLLGTFFGGSMEKLLFAGDIQLWLDGQGGSGFGGWVVMLLPVSALLVVVGSNRFLGPRFREFASRSTRKTVAVADFGRFLAISLATVILSILVASVFTAIGFDPRGTNALLGTYVQRNALVVGFVMGFAIIPIIYTIAEDALSAVPDHLRAASLGAGATQWQTAIRVVLPTAMSGLFSAIMIGLGRAVGETMIVLMAAGNTPILQMNIFNGFRTLSANIAVELPEAVRDSTHYRTLFLAALLLFTMTFIINTVAEMVRLRFRRRSAQI